MTTRALKSVMPNSHQQQQSSTPTGLDSARYDPFAASAILPPDNPAMRPQLREDSGNRTNIRSSPRKPKEALQGESKPLARVTRIKRSASFKSFLPGKDTSKSPIKSPKKKDENTEEKALKKSKSSTSLSALLSRPRSSKGAKTEEARGQKEKENRTPPRSADLERLPPIWAQFATTATIDAPNTTKVPLNDRRVWEEEMALYTPNESSPSKQRNFNDNQRPNLSGRVDSRPRPKSECLGSGLSSANLSETLTGLRRSGRDKGQSKGLMEASTPYSDERLATQKPICEEKKDGVAIDKRGSRVMAAAAFFNGKTKDLPKEPVERPESTPLEQKDIESAFEALLETRNVPQATRDKMRSLDTGIKADFIKQDKAGSGSTSRTAGLTMQQNRPAAGKRAKTEDGAFEHADEQQGTESSKKPRPRSLTFTFSKGDQSPSKKQKSGGHERTRSGQLTPSTTSNSLAPTNHGHGVSLFSKADKFALPEQVIVYLRKVQEPQSVEVGKIQKLRQLLRNETVGWVEAFVTQGGMAEVVELLYRTIAVEWREEHEDTLLHENLLCLKALSTTSSAMNQISAIQSTLFPTLLKMLFDEERKGPSEYNTRTIIINLLHSYLVTSINGTLSSRANTLLGYLRDQSPPEEARAPAFITSIYHPRPYRIWNKELNNLTKEVFWIFLHRHNIIPYPPAPPDPNASYQARHFPKEHPPVPAAPYIGGVEWDATAYLTAHVDLINGLIASLPTQAARNNLRQEMKDSGFERLMGASLRTCKEKFYGSVHEALSVWVGAAHEDGWPDKDVRQGPSKEESVKSQVKKGKKKEQAPKLEMPKFELGGGGAGGGDGGWL